MPAQFLPAVILNLAESRVEYHEGLEDVHFRRAKIAYNMGDFDIAIQHFLRARMFELDVDLWRIGLAQLWGGYSEDAIYTFTAILQNEPDAIHNYYWRALARIMQNVDDNQIESDLKHSDEGDWVSNFLNTFWRYITVDLRGDTETTVALADDIRASWASSDKPTDQWIPSNLLYATGFDVQPMPIPDDANMNSLIILRGYSSLLERLYPANEAIRSRIVLANEEINKRLV
jgi:tetratricopeptide (TPR) repeat protein